MRTVVILNNHLSRHQPFEDMASLYRAPYETLSDLAARRDLAVYRAACEWYDPAKRVFSRAWRFADAQWRLEQSVAPNLIFDKTSYTAESRATIQHLEDAFPFINDTEFSTLLDNKLYTALVLPRYSKTHYKAYTPDDVRRVARGIASQKIVVKKSYGSGGHCVNILPKNDATRHTLTYPVIVQEFIDSSNGIPGFVRSPHDVRVVFIEDEYIYAYARIPAAGSDLANIAQGGSILPMRKDDLPATVWPVVRDIQQTFASFRYKVYAIDLMFDENGAPWIVELNSKPGLFFSDDQRDAQDKMFTCLIDLFHKASTPNASDNH